MVDMNRFGFGLLLLTLCGCGSGSAAKNEPPLHPVQGKIVRGGQPVSGGRVEMRNQNDPNAPMMTADVGNDGTFNPTTFRDGKAQVGIPEGSYEVTYLASKDGQMFDVIKLKTPFVVKSGDNKLEFDVGKK
jgi:hypothetical protein